MKKHLHWKCPTKNKNITTDYAYIKHILFLFFGSIVSFPFHLFLVMVSWIIISRFSLGISWGKNVKDQASNILGFF